VPYMAAAENLLRPSDSIIDRLATLAPLFESR
jgi:hypothetical protein